MKSGTGVFRSVLASLLSLTLGGLVAVGATAGVAFATMRRLDPSLPGFQAVGDHWSIAAGHVFQPIFVGATLAAAVLTIVAGLLAFPAVRGMRPVFRKNIVGWLFLLAVVSVASASIAGRMSGDWRAFVDAAKSGDAATAQTHRTTFERMHPIASSVLKGQTLGTAAVLVLVIAGCRRKAQVGAGS